MPFPTNHRRHPAHYRPINYRDRPTIVFVTVCSRDRQPILANDDTHQALHEAWLAADQWVIGSYMIMPDHLHLFCAPGVVNPCGIRQWSTYWKRLASKADSTLKGNWQNDCWDTQVRSASQYREKLDYVIRNPVRAKLAESPENWRFRGKIIDLPWWGASSDA